MANLGGPEGKPPSQGVGRVEGALAPQGSAGVVQKSLKSAGKPGEASVLHSDPVFTRPEALRLLKAIANVQADSYGAQLRRFEAYDSRRGSIAGTLRNVLSYLADPQVGTPPKLLETSFARGEQLDPKAVFPQLQDRAATAAFRELLEELYKTGKVEAVVSPRGRGGLGVVGVRIVSQELFDAVK